MPLSVRERLLWDLNQIRAELRETVEPIQDIDYAPAAGMKSYRDLLIEIGAIEAESALFLIHGTVLDWEALQARVTGTTAVELLTSLDAIRGEMLDYLATADDETFDAPLAIPEEWEPFFGANEVLPRELFQWVARHEYYHLAQIVSYRWAQGHTPYAAPSP